MGTEEVTKLISSSVKKLIDSVSKAIGKVYEPTYIKKMANAKAYEIEAISEAIRNNIDVPIVYDSSGLTVDTSNYEDLVKRASNRLAFQELSKQQNIDAVVNEAYEELKDVETVSSDPVSPDWMIRFFNSVEDISNEEMQELWGRILAGEIKKPNSYTYRTLEKLRNMTKQDAEYFEEVSSLALQIGNEVFILQNDEILNKYNVDFSTIMKLDDCGLIKDQANRLNVTIGSGMTCNIHNSEIIGIIEGKNVKEIKIELNAYAFTTSGKELMSVVNHRNQPEYFLDCLKYIQKNNESVVITAHKINYFDDGKINYNSENILDKK